MFPDYKPDGCGGAVISVRQISTTRRLVPVIRTNSMRNGDAVLLVAERGHRPKVREPVNVPISCRQGSLHSINKNIGFRIIGAFPTYKSETPNLTICFPIGLKVGNFL